MHLISAFAEARPTKDTFADENTTHCASQHLPRRRHPYLSESVPVRGRGGLPGYADRLPRSRRNRRWREDTSPVSIEGTPFAHDQSLLEDVPGGQTAGC